MPETQRTIPAPIAAPAPAPVPPATLTMKHVPAADWKRAGLVAAVLFLIGAVVILILFKSRDQDTALSAASLPTSTIKAFAVQQAVSPSPTSSPTSTSTPLLVIPTAIPTISVPTQLPVSAVPSTALVPAQIPHQYALLIARHADQSLYVVNIGLDPFP